MAFRKCIKNILDLVAGGHSTKLRKCATVYDLQNCGLIGKIVEVLQYEPPKHQFQPIGFMTALSFVVVRLNERFPLATWDDAIHLCQEFFYLCPYLCHFIVERGLYYLLIHTTIFPYCAVFRTTQFLSGVALTMIIWNSLRL